MTLVDLEAILLTGLVLASLYALMSTGLSMVWGTLRIFNFAHGALMTLGAYVAWWVSQNAGISVGVSVLVAIVVLIGIGLVLERLLIAPFAKRADAALVAIITTLAGSIFLQNATQLIWGPRIKQLPTLISGSVSIFGTSISMQEVFTIVMAPLLLVGLALFLKYTRVGLAIRAVEQNRYAAYLAGVNPALIYAIVFGLSAGMAAIAGIMLGSIRFITPTLGDAPLLKAFIVVILGGLGSLRGTIAGAYFVGMLEAASISILGLYWTPVVLFAVMIVVLVFRPNGLFGAE